MILKNYDQFIVFGEEEFLPSAEEAKINSTSGALNSYINELGINE